MQQLTGLLEVLQNLFLAPLHQMAMMSEDPDNSARMAGEGGTLLAVGGFIAALGAIKIKRS